jgi:hypothetical protein
MRQHGRSGIVRGVAGALLGTALLAGAGGCTHNYYYGTPVAVCPPGTAPAPAAVEYGSVCEVPTQVVGGGTVVAGKALQPVPALGGPRPPRVVLSEPGGSRLGWRRADPDGGLATTRVEGGTLDDSVTR